MKISKFGSMMNVLLQFDSKWKQTRHEVVWRVYNNHDIEEKPSVWYTANDNGGLR